MNSTDLKTIIESLQSDVAQIGGTLRQISETVIAEGISEYPVYIASQQPVTLGKPIFKLDEFPLNWYFNAAILEEFMRRDIVLGEKLNEFKKTYGDPLQKACIFVITPEIGQFVFVPYEVDAPETDSEATS
jgi:hypothetical protein